jgi:HEPN pEK499 p136
MNSPEVDFVERTKAILESYSGLHDISIIINCAFGLVIFPHSIVTKGMKNKTWWTELPFWDKSLGDFDDLPRFIKDGLSTESHPQKLGEMLEEVRNGLCHQPIDPINEENPLTQNVEFTGIKIEFTDRGVLRWTFQARRGDLSRFVIFLADRYLEYFRNMRSDI